jgi:hypothetical protein
MELLFDAASTSDVEEREILESAGSQYWNRAANSHPNLRPPDASSDLDMEGTDDPMVRVVHRNRLVTGGCVRLRCTIGPPPSQETSFCILLRNSRHPLRPHMSLSAPLKIPQHQVGQVVDHQPHRLSHRPSLLPLLSPRCGIALKP